MITAVLFDVDDTLVDYSGAERVGIARYLRDLGVPPHLVADGTRVWHEVMERHFSRYLDGELDYPGQRRERVRDMLRWLGRTVPGDDPEGIAALDAWFDGYRQRYETALQAYADVPGCLAALTGVRVGVVTNNHTDHQRDKLARVGLADRFECVIGTDLAGCRKPDPGIFLAGCRALGVSPSQTAYVGDKLDDDARGAAAAGLVGVWLCRGAPDPVSRVTTKVWRITGLAELPGLIHGWRASSQAHGSVG